MKNSRDLILGEVVYISIFYRIRDSRLDSLKVKTAFDGAVRNFQTEAVDNRGARRH